MTEALKHMVAAMAEEMKRQQREFDCARELGPIDLDPETGLLSVTGRQSGGAFDLERVARAGLAHALDDAFRSGFNAGADYSDPEGEDRAARQYVERILGKPTGDPT